MKRLDRALLRLADHGTAIGADALLYEVEAELGDDVVVGFPKASPVPGSQPPRRLRWVLAAILATLVLVGGPILLWTMGGDPAVVDVATTVPQTVTTFLEDPTPSTIGLPTTTTTVPVPPLLDISWTRLESPMFEDAWVGGIAAGGPGYVAVGGSIPDLDAAVWVSEDGVEWSRTESDSFGSDQEWMGSDGDQFMNSVAIGGGVIVAVGGDEIAFENRGIGAIWHSDDGVSWSRVPHTEELFGSPDGEPEGGADSQVQAVVWWRGQFVAAGYYEQRPATWTSIDGTHWDRTMVPDDTALDEIFYADLRPLGDRLVFVASDGWTTTITAGAATEDGVTWSSWGPTPEAGTTLAVLPVGDRVIGFGVMSSGWRGAAWEWFPDGAWARAGGPWNAVGGSGVIAGTTHEERVLLAWSSENTIWGTMDGGASWSTVAEFDPGYMDIMRGSRSQRSTDAVVDLIDEGDRIIAVGSVDEWNTDPDLWGRCYFDDGTGSLGSCRPIAAIWIGIPAG